MATVIPRQMKTPAIAYRFSYGARPVLDGLNVM